MAGPDDEIRNPYLLVVGRLERLSTGEVATVRSALSGAEKAMEGGAWTGGGADDFFAELSGHRSAAKRAATKAETDFEDAKRGHDEWIAKDHPDARYQSMWDQMNG